MNCISPQLTREAEERTKELSQLQEQAVKNQQMTEEIDVSGSNEMELQFFFFYFLRHLHADWQFSPLIIQVRLLIRCSFSVVFRSV